MKLRLQKVLSQAGIDHQLLVEVMRSYARAD